MHLLTSSNLQPHSGNEHEAEVKVITTKVVALRLEIKRRSAAIAKAQRKAAEANEQLMALIISLIPLNQSPAVVVRKEPAIKLLEDLPTAVQESTAKTKTKGSIVTAQVIMVTSNDLAGVLAKMGVDDLPAIYDFQGREMSFTDDGDPTIRSGSAIWRNGKICLSAEQQLNVSGGKLALELITVKGGILGVSVRDCGEVIMSACELHDCRMFGLYLDGDAKLKADNLKLTSCGVSIQLNGNSHADVTNCDISGGDEGINMSEGSRMVGTQVCISNVGGQVLSMQGQTKLSLTESTLSNNPENPGVLFDSASLLLTCCVVDGDFEVHSPATVEVSD